jgi:Protein of unknown function with PCYCGC motif
MSQESAACARRTAIGPIVGAAALAAFVFLFPFASPGAAHAGATCCLTRAAAKGRLTMDPSLFKGEVRRAYEIAQEHPGLLAQIHCYCGCEQSSEGHKNLLDCYRTRHASTCEICIGEALEGEKLSRQGLPADQIRSVLRARFDHRS